jgi:hypothetical protein
MRIAIAGTHRNGKTTLAEAFVRTHAGFELEPEPYEQLLEAGDDFLDHYDPSAFTKQLDHLVNRLARRPPGSDVVFDRSPLDFLAYIAASDRSSGWHSIDSDVLELAASGLECLDLIAWAPLASSGRTGPGRSLRISVDLHLAELIRADTLGLLSGTSPEIVEIEGSTPQRLAQLRAALNPKTRLIRRF